MTDLVENLERLHPAALFLTPAAKLYPAVSIMPRNGSTPYLVRTRADLRRAAVDIYAWGRRLLTITDQLIAAQRTATERGQHDVAHIALISAMSAQFDCGCALELAGRWHRQANLRLTQPLTVAEVDASTGQSLGMVELTTAEQVERYGRTARRYADSSLATLPESHRFSQVDNPLAFDATTMQGVPVAVVGALVWRVVLVVAGVVVVGMALRAVIEWIAPAAAARTRAHESALDQINDTLRQRQRRCGELEGAERQRCLQSALDDALTAMDAANRAAARAPISELVTRLAIVAGVGFLAHRWLTRKP